MTSELTNDISALYLNEAREPREVGGVASNKNSTNATSRSSTYVPHVAETTTNRRLPTVTVASDDAAAFWSSNVGPNSVSTRDSVSKRFMQDETCALLKESRLNSNNECLQLRQQVSALFQENCSLKENQAKLNMENRSLKKQASGLRDDNARLRDRMLHFSNQLRGLVQSHDGGVPSLLVSQPAEQVKLMLDLLNTMQRSGGGGGVSGAGGAEDGGRSLSATSHHSHHAAVSRLSSGGERHSPTGPVSWETSSDHQSLEQISNKLLDQLKQEKMELEQQYSQMVEIQKSASYQQSNDNLGQSGIDFGPAVDKDLMGALETCKNSSKLMKSEVERQNQLINGLFQQIESLQKAQTELKAQGDSKRESSSPNYLNDKSNNIGGSPSSDKIKNVGGACGDVAAEAPHHSGGGGGGAHPSLETLLKTYGNTLPGWESGRENSGPHGQPAGHGPDDDRICPMCQAVFPRSIPLREFEAHVMEHFSSEDFEIITQEND